jgi:hypothetical protein
MLPSLSSDLLIIRKINEENNIHLQAECGQQRHFFIEVTVRMIILELIFLFEADGFFLCERTPTQL